MCEPLILNGKEVAEELYSKLPDMKGKELSIITIGDDDASKVYVKNKIKDAEKVGLKGVNYRFDVNISKQDLENEIENILETHKLAGVMVQHPIPKHLEGIENRIYPPLDVDGIGDYNMYRTLSSKEPIHYPATPKGIITLLDYYNIHVEGKNVCIIGRSDIVGKPLAAMMTARNATVTLCHSKTKDLKEHTKRADIIVSAVGKPKFINSSYFSLFNRPVIIDVGMNRDENGKLCGDVDFNDVLHYVSAITPVPGGVGPMTRYALIKNCTDNYM